MSFDVPGEAPRAVRGAIKTTVRMVICGPSTPRRTPHWVTRISSAGIDSSSLLDAGLSSDVSDEAPRARGVVAGITNDEDGVGNCGQVYSDVGQLSMGRHEYEALSPQLGLIGLRAVAIITIFTLAAVAILSMGVRLSSLKPPAQMSELKMVGIIREQNVSDP